jgi:hypothetical protein
LVDWLTGAKSIVEKGGVFTLLTVGVFLTVAPTIEIVWNVVPTSTVSHENYMMAMIIGAIALGVGGALGVVAEALRGQRLMELERLNAQQRSRSADLQERLLDHLAEMDTLDRKAQIEQSQRTAAALAESFMLQGSSTSPS